MIRLIIEAGLVFLAPALLYFAVGVIRRRAASKTRSVPSLSRDIRAVADEAPYVWLFFAGAALVLMSLLAVGTPPSGSPDQHYEPAASRTGKSNRATSNEHADAVLRAEPCRRTLAHAGGDARGAFCHRSSGI